MKLEKSLHNAGDGYVIAIDGPAGSGKSTIARSVAERLGFVLLDSGALYRVAALHLLRNGITPQDVHIDDAVLQAMDLRVSPQVASMRLFLSGDEVTAAIREERVGNAASRFATRPVVRKALLDLQRSVAASARVVAEGRDMGTVVFPDARYKFFLTATLEERARRRHIELINKGESADLATVLADMRARDVRDESRAEAPLVQAQDALRIDTSRLAPNEVLDIILARIVRD